MNNNGCQNLLYPIAKSTCLNRNTIFKGRQYMSHTTFLAYSTLYVCYTAAPGQLGARPVRPNTGIWLQARRYTVSIIDFKINAHFSKKKNTSLFLFLFFLLVCLLVCLFSFFFFFVDVFVFCLFFCLFVFPGDSQQIFQNIIYLFDIFDLHLAQNITIQLHGIKRCV